jgi:class 3 adenylate cyclase
MPAQRRERKVVTVVFCDLVGFTEHSDQMDPEDVEAFLSPYHERLRSELERYGGTVEKFIGDAVMAVWGAPTAQEDDAERAVRAALANGVKLSGATVHWVNEEVDSGPILAQVAVPVCDDDDVTILSVGFTGFFTMAFLRVMFSLVLAF